MVIGTRIPLGIKQGQFRSFSKKKDRIKLHKILLRKIFFSLLKKIIAKLMTIYSTALVMSDFLHKKCLYFRFFLDETEDI